MSNTQAQIGTWNELKQNGQDEQVPIEDVSQMDNTQQVSSPNPFGTAQTLEKDYRLEYLNNNEIDSHTQPINSLHEIGSNDQEDQVDDSQGQLSPGVRQATVSYDLINRLHQAQIPIFPYLNLLLHQQHAKVNNRSNIPHHFIDHNIAQEILISQPYPISPPQSSCQQNQISEMPHDLSTSVENAQVSVSEQKDKAMENDNSQDYHYNEESFLCPCVPCCDSYSFYESLRYHIRLCHTSYFIENFPVDQQNQKDLDLECYENELNMFGCENEYDDTADEEEYDEEEEEDEEQDDEEEEEDQVQSQQETEINQRQIWKQEEREEIQQRKEKDVDDDEQDIEQNQENDDEESDPNEIQFEKKKPKKKKTSTLPQSNTGKSKRKKSE